MGIAEGLKNSIGFLTIIPVGIDYRTLDEVARDMWLFPIVGFILGGISGVIGYVSISIFGVGISSALALFALLLLTGFHHLDGLLDFGDASMFRGTIEERIKIMRDADTGVGGFGVGFFVLLMTFLAIDAFMKRGGNFFQILICGEVLAKLSMVVASWAGRPSHEGMGSAFIKAMNRKHEKVISSVSLSFVIIYPLVRSSSFILMAITIVFTLIFVRFATKLLGGLSGDSLGATNEITRAIVMLVMVLIWSS